MGARAADLPRRPPPNTPRERSVFCRLPTERLNPPIPIVCFVRAATGLRRVANDNYPGRASRCANSETVGNRLTQIDFVQALLIAERQNNIRREVATRFERTGKQNDHRITVRIGDESMFA